MLTLRPFCKVLLYSLNKLFSVDLFDNLLLRELISLSLDETTKIIDADIFFFRQPTSIIQW